MKKHLSVCLALVMVLSLCACGAPAAGDAASPAPADTQATPAPTPSPLEAADTAEALMALMDEALSGGDDVTALAVADKLLALDPENADIYLIAADIRLRAIEANWAALSELLTQGVLASGGGQEFRRWAEENQPDWTLNLPFIPDYASADEINARGSTGANKNNNGLVAAQGDWVYYADPGNVGGLWKMHLDGSFPQKLSDDIPWMINVVGDWIYYSNRSDGNAIYRIRTDGQERTLLLPGDGSEWPPDFLVIGDTLYFTDSLDDSRLKSMPVEGGEATLVADWHCSGMDVVDGWLYYYNKETGGRAAKVPLGGGQPTLLTDCAINNLCVVDGWVYYVNLDEMAHLYRVPAEGGEPELLCDINKCGNVNFLGDYIYFTARSDDGDFLFRMHLTTWELQTIGDWRPYGLNMAGNYVYALNYEDYEGLYRMNPDGSDWHRITPEEQK